MRSPDTAEDTEFNFGMRMQERGNAQVVGSLTIWTNRR